MAVTDFRYKDRVAEDQEFGWLLSDIEEYNRNHGEKSVSLVEAVRRQEIEEREAKQKIREAQRNQQGPLLEESSVIAAQQDAEGAETDEDEEQDEDEGPDLLLRESARIVADMIELNDEGLLASQLAILEANQASEAVN